MAHLHTQNEDLSLHKFGIPQLQKKKKNLVYHKVNKKNVWVSMLPSLFVIFISLKYENSKNLKIEIDFIA